MKISENINEDHLQQEKSHNLRVSLISCLLFIILTFLVSGNFDWFNNLDMAIYQLSWEPAEGLVDIVNVLAKSATIVPILIVSFIVSIFLWRDQNKLAACWNVSNVLIVSFLGFVLKHGIARSRPAVEQIYEKTSYSFPSGHSLLAMCLVCSLVIILQNQKGNYNFIKALLVTYVILIGLSRLFLRVHYPSDVIGGFLLSFTWVNFSYAMVEKMSLSRRKLSRGAKRRLDKRIRYAVGLSLIMIISSATVYAVNVFTSVKKTADAMYQPLERESTPVTNKSSEPISFLLLGIANDSKRKTDFRANTIMVVTLNNETEETTLTSIPRDAYVEIIGQEGLYDKINHAHSFGGERMIIETVENYLDIPINHYLSVNMDGLADFAEAVGGVTVDNDFEFEAEGIHYPKGKQHLNGWETLQYARMRYEDPLGDYGRQARQREVTTLLLKETMSIKSIYRYKELLNVIGDNGKTDMTLDQMITVLKNYQKALKNVESHQVQGENFTGDGYTGEEGISYQIIPEEERSRVQADLMKELNLAS